MSQDLKVRIGKPARWQVVVKRDGALVSLAGAELWFTAQRVRGAADAESYFQLTRDAGLTVEDETACTVTIEATAAQTAKFTEEVSPYWDLVVRYADGWVATGDELSGRIIPEFPATAAPAS
jgi:hypothetical protein